MRLRVCGVHWSVPNWLSDWLDVIWVRLLSNTLVVSCLGILNLKQRCCILGTITITLADLPIKNGKGIYHKYIWVKSKTRVQANFNMYVVYEQKLNQIGEWSNREDESVYLQNCAVVLFRPWIQFERVSGWSVSSMERLYARQAGTHPCSVDTHLLLYSYRIMIVITQ